MLQLMKGDELIGLYPEGGWFDLPNGDRVSPAEEGWTNGEYSLIAAPPAPDPTPEDLLAIERAEMQLSFPQMVIGLVTEGWISEADGEGWLQGILPPTVISTINLLPEADRFAAKAKATRPSYIDRNDRLVGMMALAQGRTDEEIDAFFRTYRTV